MRTYVSSKLVDSKPIEITEDFVMTQNSFNRQIGESKGPIPWFGLDYDASTKTVKPLNVDFFLAVCVEAETVYLEGWDLKSSREFKDWKKWKKFLEIPFDYDIPEPGMPIANFLEALVQDLSKYEDKFPKTEDGEPFEEILVAKSEEPESGKGIYFYQEGGSIIFKSSYKGEEKILETFDSGNKFSSFLDTMRCAMEQQDEKKEK